MNSSFSIPSLQDLKKAYETFLEKAPSSSALISPHQIILYSNWSRFDPRLGEILIRYLSQNFRFYSFFELSDQNRVSQWPNAFLVILSHVALLLHLREKKELLLMQKLCALGIPKAKDELYWIGIHAPGGKNMRKEAEEAIQLYTQWGYLSRFLMLPDRIPIKSTMIEKETRQKRIKQFLKNYHHSIIRIKDLKNYFQGKVHVRQLQRDLKELGLKARGKTKSRYYTLNK